MKIIISLVIAALTLVAPLALFVSHIFNSPVLASVIGK